MENEKTDIWITRVIIAALIGIYGFFVKHLFSHVEKLDLDKLKESVQYKDTCEEIVKRLDGNHREVCNKLDRILDKIEK